MRLSYFNLRGLRRPRQYLQRLRAFLFNFNPRGLRRPRLISFFCLCTPHNFNPRGLRRPRPYMSKLDTSEKVFQSTRSSQTSTRADLDARANRQISIHEVFADLDKRMYDAYHALGDFNPRGLRRPRRGRFKCGQFPYKFQSTRSSQTSTRRRLVHIRSALISIHEVFADLDDYPRLHIRDDYLFQSTRSSQTST